MQVVTVATPACLAQARVLGRSLARHEPAWRLDVMLLAGEEVVSAAQRQVQHEGWGQILSAAQELKLDAEALLACHPDAELVGLLVAPVLRLYVERTGASVVHLPSWAWVLGGLDPIEQALSHRATMLAPRMTADVPEDGLEPSRMQMELAGRMDETVIAADGGVAAEGFLAWWEQRVEEALGSLDVRHNGARPEDRPWLARYLELAPARFATAMLDDPGCNLNMWNMQDRTLQGLEGGATVDGRWPLRFVNLQGFAPDRPFRLAAMASRVRISRYPVLRELCEQYATELLEVGWQDRDRRAEVGLILGDGLVYDEAVRGLYALALALGEDFGDMFDEPDGDRARSFVAWMEQPAARGGAHGINRYVFQRVARERPDVMQAYPDLDGANGERYVEWCWGFGRNEIGIPDRFMPPRPGQAAARARSAKLDGPSARSDTADVGAAATHVASASASSEPSATSTRFAPDHGPAVRLTGYLGHTLGLGAAARAYAQALDAAGVPVRTVSVPLHHLTLPVELGAEYGRHEFEELVHDGRHGFELIAVNADELPSFVERLGEDYFEGPRIGIWGWETNTIPSRWQRVFPLLDEVWVYSRFMAENIGAVSPVPVVPLPPPVRPPAEPAVPLRLGVPEGFLFLFVFDYLSTIQRKNPVGLIEAFKRAFAPEEGPRLLIKTINAPLRPMAEEEVLWAAYGRTDVHVIDRSLTGAELHGLMAACDCYVSLHRSEGFGLTIAEAMAIGKPVIGTGYSGNRDFMNDENSYLVDYALGRVGADCEIYPPEGEWAEPSLEHAAELMRRVCEQPREAAQRGAQARADIARELSPAVTGARMRERLEHVGEPLSDDAERTLRRSR
jgi:glycosyltransferase involved in cell wall biosynthesis